MNKVYTPIGCYSLTFLYKKLTIKLSYYATGCGRAKHAVRLAGDRHWAVFTLNFGNIKSKDRVNLRKFARKT